MKRAFLRLGAAPLFVAFVIVAYPGALPAVRLLEQWQETSGSLESLQGLMRNASAGPYLDTGRRQSGRSTGGRIRMIEDTPERLRAEIESSEPGWLFVLRAFWPDREVTLDGRPVEAVPVQLAFSAVPVTTGLHVLDWRECVPGWQVSRWGPVLATVLVAGLIFQRKRQRRMAP